MSQRVTEQTYWIVANGADTEEMAQVIQSALISPGTGALSPCAKRAAARS